MARGRPWLWTKAHPEHKRKMKEKAKLMKTLNSRAKGANGEREFASKIHEMVGVKLVRKLDQTRGGGFDLEVDKKETGEVAEFMKSLAIECKRYGVVRPALIEGWWQQTLMQAEKAELTPVLAYRANYWDWMVIVPMSFVHPEYPFWRQLELTVTLPVQAFCTIVRERCAPSVSV